MSSNILVPGAEREAEVPLIRLASDLAVAAAGCPKFESLSAIAGLFSRRGSTTGGPLGAILGRLSTAASCKVRGAALGVARAINAANGFDWGGAE